MHLVSTTEREKENIMTSIAQAYAQEQQQLYRQQGMQEGWQQGIQQCIQTVAKNMLNRGYEPSEVKHLWELLKRRLAESRQ